MGLVNCIHNLTGLTEAYEIFRDVAVYERLADMNQTTTGQYETDEEDRSFLRWNPLVPTSGLAPELGDTILALTASLPVSFVSTPTGLSQWRVPGSDPNAEPHDNEAAWLEGENGAAVLVADDSDVFTATGTRTIAFSAGAVSAYQTAVDAAQTWFAITGRMLGFSELGQIQGTIARDPGASIIVTFDRPGYGSGARRTLLGVGK